MSATTNMSYIIRLRHAKQKRNKLKKYMMDKYGWNGMFGVRSNKILISQAYTQAALPITSTIQNLVKSKGRLAAKQKRVREIGKLVENFLDVKIRMFTSNEKDAKKQLLGRCILSKFILENETGINGRHIRNYLSVNRPMRTGTPATWRQRFTSSFKKHPENRRLYYDFLDYIKK